MSEFAPGGLIDEATTEEKDLAWMPPTNDVNEGALGAFRVLVRRQPQLTLLQYNAQAMFHINHTQEFVEKKFEREAYKFIHKMAREEDSKGHEREWNKLLVEHNEERIQKQKAASEKRVKNAAKKAGRIAAVTLIFNKEEIIKLKGEKLKDHLLAYQQAGAPNLQGITVRSPVGQIREALQAAIDRKNAGDWCPLLDYESDACAEKESSEENAEWEDLEE